MAAGHQQGHERRLRRVVLHQRRQQMAFHMVDSDGRHIQAPGQRTGHAGADQQRANQARASGIGHALDLGDGDAGLVQGLADQRQGLAHVVAAGQLGHHPAVFGVQRNLAVDGVRTQRGRPGKGGVVDGYARLITG